MNTTRIAVHSGDAISDVSLFFPIFFFSASSTGRRLAGTASWRLCFEFSSPYNSPYTPSRPHLHRRHGATRCTTNGVRYVLVFTLSHTLFSRHLPPFRRETYRPSLYTRGKRIGPFKHSPFPLWLFRPWVKYFSHTFGHAIFVADLNCSMLV